MNEYELFQALRPHFPVREFALLPQVANGTGSNARRHADALALGLWPSRGMRLHGFEIKSYRGDWVRELTNPEKAEEIAAFCNHWWIVTAHPGMVKDGELPPLWGLMEYDPDTKALVKKTAASYRESKPVDLAFVAAMLRKAQEVCTPEGVLQERYDAGFAEGKKAVASNNEYALRDFADLKKRVAEFEKTSGVRLERWRSGEEIGEAVRIVLNGSIETRRNELVRVAERIIKELRTEAQP